jgi:uncharacterized cupredoxin-like copper-binding protein
MKNKLFRMFAVIIGLSCSGSAIALGDMAKQIPIEVKVQLSDHNNVMRFLPSFLEFETGKLYKLVLHNASTAKHYFSSEGLARSVFTRKVQVIGQNGKTIAEVKGSIREIEVYPGGTTEWWFVPVTTAMLTDLKCTIKGHAEAGMVGKITIK